MDVELSVPIAVSVRQPPGTDEPGAGDCLAGHLGQADAKSGIDSKDRADRCGDADPAIRRCTKDIGSHIANKYLALFLLIFSRSLIDEFIFQSHCFYQYPNLMGLIWPLDFLYGPLFYYYLRLLTAVDLDQASRGKRRHFALFGVGIVLVIPFWVLSGEQKLAFKKHTGMAPTQFRKNHSK